MKRYQIEEQRAVQHFQQLAVEQNPPIQMIVPLAEVAGLLQVRKAVRWNSPFYGIEGQGWFLGFHVFTHYVKVTFFRGTSLRPVPLGGTGKDARWIDIHEDDLDEVQMATWVKQRLQYRAGATSDIL